MLKFRLCLAVAAAVVAFCVWSPRADGAGDQPATAKRILIVLDPQADDTDNRIAEVLKARIERRCAATVSIARTAEPADLVVYLGTSGRKGPLDSLCAAHGVKLPGRKTPAPEGLAIRRYDWRTARLSCLWGRTIAARCMPWENCFGRCAMRWTVSCFETWISPRRPHIVSADPQPIRAAR